MGGGCLPLIPGIMPVTSLRRLTTLCSLAGLPVSQKLAYDLETAGSDAERHRRPPHLHRPARQLWVSPDCGLKTRAYKETKASIESLVAATEAVRASLTVAI